MAKAENEPWDLWLAYQAQPSDDLRNELTMHYLPLVEHIARKQWSRLQRRFAIDELVSAGAEGLMQAIDTFEVGRGWSFATFAPRRIVGAMLDYVRSLDHVPRLVRAHRRLLEEAAAAIGQATGMPATAEQLRRAVALDDQQFQAAMLVRDTESLAKVVCDGESRQAQLGSLLVDEAHAGRGRRRETREAVLGLLAGCSDRERMLVLLYSVEGWTMKQIGESLGLCESRVSQMYSALIDRLRERALMEGVSHG